MSFPFLYCRAKKKKEERGKRKEERGRREGKERQLLIDFFFVASF